MESKNRHHIFYPKKQWARRNRKTLREHRLSIIKMDGAEHQKLHTNLSNIEHLFYPSYRTVNDMLDYAEQLLSEEQDHQSIESISNRLDSWAKIATGNRDKNAAQILRKQIDHIQKQEVKPEERVPLLDIKTATYDEIEAYLHQVRNIKE